MYCFVNEVGKTDQVLLMAIGMDFKTQINAVPSPPPPPPPFPLRFVIFASHEIT